MRQVDSNIRSRLLMARMPAMPQILLKLLEQCQSEDVGMGSLAALIAKDPGITCKVLAVANSSAYHRGGGRIYPPQDRITASATLSVPPDAGTPIDVCASGAGGFAILTDSGNLVVFSG